jgi:hypothetical protein
VQSPSLGTTPPSEEGRGEIQRLVLRKRWSSQYRLVQDTQRKTIEGETIMSLIRFIKSLFAPPSPESIALRELEESRRELLSAQTSQEYAAKMAEFHKGKIKRLTAFLKETMEEEQS